MSEKEKQCPGPWTITDNSWQYTTVYDADGYAVCRLDLEDWGVNEDNQDTLERLQAKVAAVIAAAPDLLAALKAAKDFIGNGYQPPELVEQMFAAIEKAQGRG